MTHSSRNTSASVVFLILASLASAEVVLHVDDDAPTGGDGTSWATAFDDLDLAMAAAQAGDQIWVAEGTYKPDGGNVGGAFTLRDHVSLYGGFAGNELSLPQRARRFDATVLSGDLAGNDGPNFENRAENSYRIVRAVRLDSAFLDGFKVTAAEGNGVYFSQCASMTIRNCLFELNRSDQGGGAIGFTGGQLRIESCVFRGNSSLGGGAILFSPAGSVCVIRDSLFAGNMAARTDFPKGGAIWAGQGGYLDAVGCTFVGNRAIGSASWGYQGYGGAVHSYYPLNISNCVFWANVAGNHPDVRAPAAASISFTNLPGNQSDSEVPASDPILVSTGVWDNADTPLNYGDDAWIDGDNILAPNSPLINAGDPDFVVEPNQLDLDGHARVLCGRLDMGAYEFGIGDFDCNRDVDLFDFASWAECFTGPQSGGAPVGIPPLPYGRGSVQHSFDAGCEALDFDGDLDVDWADFGGMQIALGAPEP